MADKYLDTTPIYEKLFEQSVLIGITMRGNSKMSFLVYLLYQHLGLLFSLYKDYRPQKIPLPQSTDTPLFATAMTSLPQHEFPLFIAPSQHLNSNYFLLSNYIYHDIVQFKSLKSYHFLLFIKNGLTIEKDLFYIQFVFDLKSIPEIKHAVQISFEDVKEKSLLWL